MAGAQLTSLLYADDIALIAGSADMLQQMLTAVSEYARRWRFHFNPRKSHVVVQGREADIAAARATQWLLDGHRIETVDEC